ncbi:MAG: DNA polymerase III subunit gamma/tau [Thiohalospira sp.]
MSYQVLARKWRPRSFPELVGQENVVRALTNALDRDRVHHALLLTGTRGVGKTTIARILAKSLNCDEGVSASPCGVCESCRAIDEGRFPDLLEVDAASRTKVDDTRELLDNVQYAPARGRYKVYLVDEVHMLSTHSFNALLKTLEEPPPHVKFLLATTDPQKLPVTVLSRCLRFNLKPLPARELADYLTRILEAEGLPAERGAVAAIARAAEGSVRDALSLLDQAIAFSDGLREDEVAAMLGTVGRERVASLLERIHAGDAPGTLAAVAEMTAVIPDPAGLLTELVSYLHRLAVAQFAPEAVDDGLGEDARLRELAASMEPEAIQLYYQIALHGRRDLPLAPDPRGGLEMALLRMIAFRPDDATAAPAGPAPSSARPAGEGATPADAATGPASPAAESPPAETRTEGPAGNDSPSGEARGRLRSLLDQGPETGRPEAAPGAAAPEPPPAAPEPPVAEEPPAPDLETAAEPESEPEPEPEPAREAPLFEAVEETGPQPAESEPNEPARDGSKPEGPNEGGPESPGPAAGTPEPPGLDTSALGSTSPPEGSAAPGAGAGDPDPETWRSWVAAMPTRGLTRELLRHTAWRGRQGRRVTLALESSRQPPDSDRYAERIAEALTLYLGEQVKVDLVPEEGPETPAALAERAEEEQAEAAREAIETDPMVQQLCDTFDARVDPATIRPLESGESAPDPDTTGTGG